MFFVTYVRRELRRRMRQAIFVALGLALGVGLVVTVAAASAGVARAQSGVLSTLYGEATTVTVTGGQWQQPSRLPKGTKHYRAGPRWGDLHPRGQVHQRGREDAEHDRHPDRGDQRGEGSRGGPAARRGGGGRRDLPEPLGPWPKNGASTARGAASSPGGGRTGGSPLGVPTPGTRRWALEAARR